jgi:hypothetical protein
MDVLLCGLNWFGWMDGWMDGWVWLGCNGLDSSLLATDGMGYHVANRWMKFDMFLCCNGWMGSVSLPCCSGWMDVWMDGLMDWGGLCEELTTTT